MSDRPTKMTNESGEWETIPLTDEEIAEMEADQESRDVDMNNIRPDRNGLLAMCDWTQMPDSPLSDEKKAEWATYRQELRDMPAGFTKVSEVVFPTPPE